MRLIDLQIDAYRDKGVLLVQEFFSQNEVDLLRSEIERLASDGNDTNLKEMNSKVLRALHGCDQRSKVMWNLVRHERLLSAVQEMLGGPVYLHQFKVSMKAAFEGDVWKWHQDFIYWHDLDALPESKALTVGVFLNEVNHFNAPTWVIPGSHTQGLLQHRDPNMRASTDPARPVWHDNVVADFRYILENDVVTALANSLGIMAAVGPAGTVLFFHSSIVHASTRNLSPWERIAILITYNRVDNQPRIVANLNVDSRPAFLVNRDYNELKPVPGLTT